MPMWGSAVTKPMAYLGAILSGGGDAHPSAF
jgi:hypothetical protein